MNQLVLHLIRVFYYVKNPGGALPKVNPGEMSNWQKFTGGVGGLAKDDTGTAALGLGAAGAVGLGGAGYAAGRAR